ncbi:MAG: UDP-N-acetylmuramoyl-L-alanyl-D-glutamate--2,6-diaminopimelate ligase [Candidatus Omnitrophica bacterium]|nr:UDP-N-acetylmuramoyl-L-alanyl-D-glutamate--2,6-diaminopimelate ligase [Candidatus Omnitrophota bacterium]
MKLNKLLRACHLKPVAMRRDVTMRGITANSKEVRNKFMFVAVAGNRADGHRFVEEAVARKAGAVVVERVCKSLRAAVANVPLIKVKDSRKALGMMAAHFYGNPAQSLKVIGVTGTNGKTTITYLIEAILAQAGYSAAVVGTVNHRFKSTVIPSHNTTPGPIELQQLLSQMVRGKTEFVAMEVSSHALDQQRVAGISFHSAIFTNLTQDHLDYHQTMNNYFQAKSKLFQALSPDAFALINADDPWARRLACLTKAEVITFGLQRKSDIMAEDIILSPSKTSFCLKTHKEKRLFSINLIGQHNVVNVLAAVAWAMRSGIDLTTIQRAVERFVCVPGRLEKIDSPRQGFCVFVDYAHTEDALAHAIGSLRNLTKKRVLVVFGCGGERDKDKRPKMGNVVSRLADFAIVTNDNPRSEEPERIIADITKGMQKDNYCVIPERMAAIKQSLTLATAGDVVLIAGKGHENYQVIGNQSLLFDDREAVKACLKSMR